MIRNNKFFSEGIMIQTSKVMRSLSMYYINFGNPSNNSDFRTKTVSKQFRLQDRKLSISLRT